MVKRIKKSGVEHLAQHPGWRTTKPKHRRGLSAGRERMLKSDAYTQVLDDALTAAEAPLKRLLKNFQPEEVQDAFLGHVATHLLSELHNIKEHGHRNDDPKDVPPACEYSLYSEDDGIVLFDSEKDALVAKAKWEKAGANGIAGPFPH